MQERQVTLADTTFPLDDPFWVLATQNPVEQEGVYALPEAQLDRFSMMLRVGYPSGGARESRCCTSRVDGARPSSARVAGRRHAAARVHPRHGVRRRQAHRLHRPARTRDATSRRRSAAGSRGAAACSASRRARTSTCWRWRASPRSCTAAPTCCPADVKEIFLRRGAPPHRPQHPRAGGEHRRRRASSASCSSAVPIP